MLRQVQADPGGIAGCVEGPAEQGVYCQSCDARLCAVASYAEPPVLQLLFGDVQRLPPCLGKEPRSSLFE